MITPGGHIRSVCIGNCWRFWVLKSRRSVTRITITSSPAAWKSPRQWSLFALKIQTPQLTTTSPLIRTGSMPNNPFATPRHVTNLDDCIFYHTIDLPEVGTVAGYWDIRGKESQYL